jgi:hypothetical protein
LTRTGYAPLAFDGEIIAEGSTKTVEGFGQNRWYECRVYRATTGEYVIEIVYSTQWQGEQDYHCAEARANASNIEMVLREFQCDHYVQGYPPGDHYADKQGRLVQYLQQRYESLVSKILGQIPQAIERLGD